MDQEINKYILSYFVSIGFLGIILVLVFFDIKEGSKEIVYTLLGAFGTAFSSIINYYFGSSEGSKNKTDIIKGIK